MRQLLLSILTCPLFAVRGFQVRVHDAISAAVAYVVASLAYDPSSGVQYADNTFLTISMITREALMVLENSLTFTKRVNRQFDDRFGVDGAKIGDTLNVRKPPRYTIRTGQSMVVQDMTETQVPVKLDQQIGVDLQFSSSDLKLKIDDFSKRFIAPAITTIANEIDRQGLALYNQIYQVVGTPGAVPNTALTYLQAGVLLSNAACPTNSRSVVITPLMEATIVDALKTLFNKSSSIASQYEKGQMGTALGFDFYMDQNVATHTVGPLGGVPLVNLANQTGSTLNLKGFTAAVGPRLNKGDVFTVAGVYMVNPQSRQSTGQLQQFVVKANTASDVAGLAAVQIDPPITPTGQFQTVSASPADGAPVTVLGTAGAVSPQGLAFHPDAFTLVTADLPVPSNQEMAGRANDKQLGISIRMIRDYAILNDQYPCRLDVLFGWAVLRPELACRVAA